jgi:hypothetical protein
LKEFDVRTFVSYGRSCRELLSRAFSVWSAMNIGIDCADVLDLGSLTRTVADGGAIG